MVSIEPYIRQIFYESVFPTGTSQSMVYHHSSCLLLLCSPALLYTCSKTVFNNLPLKLEWIYPKVESESGQFFIQDIIAKSIYKKWVTKLLSTLSKDPLLSQSWYVCGGWIKRLLTWLSFFLLAENHSQLMLQRVLPEDILTNMTMDFSECVYVYCTVCLCV